LNTLDTDYLVIGSGTAGLAFTDTLIDQTDAHVTLVDRHGKPGGHWNDAYPFVTLHQPSAFYGVNSMELGERRIDTHGLNEGLQELASGPEISAYFERVMNHKLLPSARVSYHPMSNFVGDLAAPFVPGPVEFENLLSGERTRVNVRRKLVDARYLSPKVAATHVSNFEVEPGVRLVPPNALPGLWNQAPGQPLPRRFVIVGAGKTAMDAGIWLLNAGAAPDSIQWVVPRDSWLINRITTQPSMAFFKEAIGGQADQMAAFAQASSVDDLFLRLEACGALLRICPDHTPSMFHLATTSSAEVAVLQRIRQVVRLGRVQRLAGDHMQLQQGRVPVEPNTLFVDCTASAVEKRPLQPSFQGHKIVLQMLRLPAPAFSAALTAYVEAHGGDEAQCNRLCTPLPFPWTLRDYPPVMAANLKNQMTWGQDKALRTWIRQSRLDGFGKLVSGIDPTDTDKLAIMARLKEQTAAAMANLPRLMAG
jgi:hypothetical protein